MSYYVSTLSLLLLASTVFVFAQEGTYTTDDGGFELCFAVRCNGEEQSCNTVDTRNFRLLTCRQGLICSDTIDGVCRRLPQLGESCAVVHSCYSPEGYDIVCDNSDNTCRYASGPLGPGEACPSDVSMFESVNPCTTPNNHINNCTNNCGEVSDRDGFCDNQANWCPIGQYCQAGQCTDRLAAGTNCTSTSQCQYNTRCSSLGTSTPIACTELFSRTQSQSCQDVYDCQPGLLCTGTCVSPDANGRSCDILQPSSCPTGYSCVCDGGPTSTDGKCRARVVSSSVAQDIRNFYNCMGDNCPWDISISLFPLTSHTAFQVTYHPLSCVARSCVTEYDRLRNYISSLNDPCSSSSVLSALFFAILSLSLLLIIM